MYLPPAFAFSLVDTPLSLRFQVMSVTHMMSHSRHLTGVSRPVSVDKWGNVEGVYISGSPLPIEFRWTLKGSKDHEETGPLGQRPVLGSLVAPWSLQDLGTSYLPSVCLVLINVYRMQEFSARVCLFFRSSLHP